MYASKEEIARAREVDLLTYLQSREPDKLVHLGGNVYCTTEHDSLKISNGLWTRWSRGFGGKTALDYLVQVEGLPLPPAHTDHRRVFAYLCARGIDPEVLNHCFKHGLLYEEAEHHNAVFVGMDDGGTPRYATLDKLTGRNWRSRSYLSLGGITKCPECGPPKLPVSLAHYLKHHPDTENVVLCLDADTAGRAASLAIAAQLPGLTVWDRPPRQGKDYNALLQLKKGIAAG